MRLHKPKRARGMGSTASRSRGSTLIEFALVVLMFLVLCFVLVGFSYLFFAQSNAASAVREAGRYAVTGQHLPDPKHQDQNLSRVDSIKTVLLRSVSGVTVSDVQISSLRGGSGSAGGPGDTVTVKAICSVPFLNTFGRLMSIGPNYQFAVSVSFKNEPFPPDQTK